MKLMKQAGCSKYKLIIKQSELDKLLKTASSFTSPLGIVFIEGNKLNLGKRGYFTVNSIDLDNKIASLIGEDGTKLTVDMENLTNINTDVNEYLTQKSIKQEQEDKIKKEKAPRTHKPLNSNLISGEEAFYFMGLICAKGKITAQVPKKDAERFVKQYEELTGHPIKEETYKQIDISSDESKWYPQLRVHLPNDIFTQLEIDMAKKLGFDLRKTNIGHDINDSKYARKLFDLGFTIGKNQSNADRIANRIEKQYGLDAKNAFEKGFMTY